jgi:hypothetical protein
MLIDTDAKERYPYIAISPEYDKFIHICPESIAVHQEKDAVNFDAEYILTERTFNLDMRLVEHICTMWAQDGMYEMTIFFTGSPHITIWQYDPVRNSHPCTDFVLSDRSILTEVLVKHLYPIFEPIYQFVQAVD